MINILSVSDITSLIRDQLETQIPPQYIEGEISECKFHGSGHIYLVLKDSQAVLPAVIWRRTAQRLDMRPAVGQNVIAYGRLSVYPPHGRYQFMINHLQESGTGMLYAKFENLKKRLLAEGLFSGERKLSLPDYPMTVGLVTSSTGAALQDMLRIFAHDAPHVQLILSPARVQGRGAHQTVADALERLISYSPDCVIISRGGGSIEDLWAFNEEELARYVSDYSIPLISGIGHETDISILDFVADYRASTPTNAAEHVCRSWKRVADGMSQLDYQMDVLTEKRIAFYHSRCEYLESVTGSDRFIELWTSWYERISVLSDKLNESINRLPEKLERILAVRRRMLITMRHKLEIESARISNLFEKYQTRFRQIISVKKDRLNGLENQLKAYNPAHVLKKGYSIVQKNNTVIRTVKDLRFGDDIIITLSDGTAESKVKKTNKGDS